MKMKSLMRGSVTIFLGVGLLQADVSYTQDVKFLGGSMVEMMQKMASMPMMGRMKQAFEDQHYDVYVKGNKMARLGQANSTIYDLDAGTITTINNQKRTYSTVTFDEMKAQMEQAQQKMKRGDSGSLDFDIKVEKTSETRTIQGQTAKEMLIIMTAKQASAQGQMVIKTDNWFIPAQEGSKELREFSMKLSEKFSYATVPMFANMPGASKGVAEAMKQASKEDGSPVLMDMDVSGITAMGASGDPNTPVMKMETLNGRLTVGSIDDGKFAIPAGYKEEKRSR